MPEIQKLKMKLADEGWERSGGRSNNVWIKVLYPQELLDFQNAYKDKRVVKPKTNNKCSVWTPYDDYISNNDIQQSDELPMVSATFKSCFTKYGAVCENMGMKFSMALDMPTSYNYIVAFDPEEYPQIVDNYPSSTAKKSLMPYGIVSIDFLQNKPTEEVVTKKLFRNEKGKLEEIDSYSAISGDELISFEDAFARYNISINNKDGKENLIENWIKAVDEIARKELSGCPEKFVQKNISQIHSRIARSFLLKDGLLGDCDFTAYNGGVVLNKATMKLRYTPNFDYGECFNGLIRNKLEFDPYCGMTPETFNSLPLEWQNKIRVSKQKDANLTVKDIARQYASGTSEQNIKFIIKNYPDACKEFFENLDKMVKSGTIDNIVDSYKDLTCNGKQLITEEERNAFKEYLYERQSFLRELYIETLKANNMNVPISEDDFTL